MLPKNVSIIFIENWNYDADCESYFFNSIRRKLNNRFLIKLNGDVTEYVKAEHEGRVPNKYLHNVPALHVVLYEKSSNEYVYNNNLKYIHAAEVLKNEYNIITIDHTDMVSDEDY